MPLTKARELKQLSADELAQRADKLIAEFYELTQKKEIGQLDRPHRLKNIRREIAQIMTVKNQLEKEQK